MEAAALDVALAMAKSKVSALEEKAAAAGAVAALYQEIFTESTKLGRGRTATLRMVERVEALKDDLAAGKSEAEALRSCLARAALDAEVLSSEVRKLASELDRRDERDEEARRVSIGNLVTWR